MMVFGPSKTDIATNGIAKNRVKYKAFWAIAVFGDKR